MIQKSNHLIEIKISEMAAQSIENNDTRHSKETAIAASQITIQKAWNLLGYENPRMDIKT